MRRVFLPALWDTAKFWARIEIAHALFVAVRGMRRWMRVPLREREAQTWARIVYVMSGNETWESTAHFVDKADGEAVTQADLERGEELAQEHGWE